ncbi:50S ribosomal protein L22 [Linum perenne]
MVGWQRHVLQSLCRQVGRRLEGSSVLPGKSQCLERFRSSPSPSLPPLYQYLQHAGIACSRTMLAFSSEEKPIPSPLTPMLALDSGKSEEQKEASKPAKVQAILKGIKQSPKKVNLVAALVRGMRVEDALLQLQVTVKRAAKTVYQVIHSARANATHNHGLNRDRLLVGKKTGTNFNLFQVQFELLLSYQIQSAAEAFLGKGYYKKRVSYHSKGRHGIKMRPECRLTVVLRETTIEEEAEIARLKVHNFRKLNKRESRLVPHKLIEVDPVWDRKGKRANQEPRREA